MNRPPLSGESAPSSKTVLRWAAILFALGLAAGLAMMLVGFRGQSLVDTRFDPYGFGDMGRSLARGDGFPHQAIQRRAPLYPLMIAVVYTLFGERPSIVLFLQCLFLAGTAVLVFDLGRRLFNLRTGIIAGVVCALHPMMLRYVSDLHLETLLTFLTTFMVWATVRMRERPTVPNGLLVGVTAALAALTKAVVLLYPALFGAALLLEGMRAARRGERTRLPWVPLAAMLASMGAVISPWTIHNYRVSGHFIPISTGTSDAFLRGFIFSKTQYALLREPPYVGAENECNALFASLAKAAGTEWQKDDWETDQLLNRAAKEKLLSDPLGTIRKFFVGLAAFWYQMTTLKNSLLTGGLALVAWGFALVGWRAARRIGARVWPLLMPAIYLNVLLAALLALGRYSAPILPGLLVVAAFGFDRLISRRSATAAPGLSRPLDPIDKRRAAG